jgi:(4-O-methyl)-D-glucuronate---lignin esterase
MRGKTFLLISALLTGGLMSLGQNPPNPANLGNDANGNPLRKAFKSGHISNYDESKVPPYSLPDPLVLSSGKPVRNADTWTKQRRPELIKLYETEIYGRVPANAPKVTWEVGEVDREWRNGTAIRKKLVAHARAGSPSSDERRFNVWLYTPAKATKPVPVLLSMIFAPAARGGGPAPTGEPPVADEMLARGWGYATVVYSEIQPDRANAWKDGVIGLTLASDQTEPRPDEWGTISAWAWGISRIMDYFETDKAVDAKRVAIQGFSRLGKTVLWAGAKDTRVAAVFSGCAGELGSALARRDWGETVDDMAQNFAWQFSGNLQKYVGRWNDMPVDAHMLIALNVPRPVFITGGTTDQWSDPRGEFLAEVAAGPVYRLFAKKDLGTTSFPEPDSPVVSGTLAFHYHTGGHTLTLTEWKLFLEFLTRHFE